MKSECNLCLRLKSTSSMECAAIELVLFVRNSHIKSIHPELCADKKFPQPERVPGIVNVRPDTSDTA